MEEALKRTQEMDHEELVERSRRGDTNALARRLQGTDHIKGSIEGDEEEV